MNEQLFLGGRPVGLGACPVVRPEGIYLNGVRVIRIGMEGVGLGDVGDLLAYRQEWEPFIAAHLNLWRDVNSFLESSSFAPQCPPGVFEPSQINTSLSDPARAFCAQLSLSRMQISDTNPGGILTRWNAWANKSSADMIAGAAAMLEWQQEVVMGVGGPDKDKLVQIAKSWNLHDLQLPAAPSFTTQQDIIARIQGAYVTTKGVLQILGYGVGETITGAGNVAQAVAQGLTDTAKALPKAINWALIAGGVTVAVVAGALVIYYVPRRSPPTRQTLPA